MLFKDFLIYKPLDQIENLVNTLVLDVSLIMVTVSESAFEHCPALGMNSAGAVYPRMVWML